MRISFYVLILITFFVLPSSVKSEHGLSHGVDGLVLYCAIIKPVVPEPPFGLWFHKGAARKLTIKGYKLAPSVKGWYNLQGTEYIRFDDHRINRRTGELWYQSSAWRCIPTSKEDLKNKLRAVIEEGKKKNKF